MKIVFDPRPEDYIEYIDQSWRSHRWLSPTWADIVAMLALCALVWLRWHNAERELFPVYFAASYVLSIPFARLRWRQRYNLALWRQARECRKYALSRTVLELAGDRLLWKWGDYRTETPLALVSAVDETPPEFVKIAVPRSRGLLIRRSSVIEGNLDEFARQLRAAANLSCPEAGVEFERGKVAEIVRFPRTMNWHCEESNPRRVS